MIIIDEDARAFRHPVRPEYINTDRPFQNAFGNVRMEYAARFVVKTCQEMGGWKPFTGMDIHNVHKRYSLHKIFAFEGLLNGGFIVLSNDARYRVTHEFILKCFIASPSPGILVDPQQSLPPG